MTLTAKASVQVSKMKINLVFFAVLVALAVAQTTRNTPTASKASIKPGPAVTAKTTATTKASSNPPDFSSWKTKHQKSYALKATAGNKTEAQAQATYNQNVASIAKHNANVSATYKQSANSNADCTQSEINKRKGYKSNPSQVKANAAKAAADKTKTKEGKKYSAISKHSGNYTEAKAPKKSAKAQNIKSSAIFNTTNSQNLKAAIPDSLDYTSQIGAVNDQGACGSSWAFATTCMLEYWSKKNGTNQVFSEQYLVDCDPTNNGCDGGDPANALYSVMNNGISDGTKYKYVAKKQNCMTAKYPQIYNLQNMCYVTLGGDEAMLKIMLIKYGPLATGINTSGTGFDFYTSGVFSGPCSSDPQLADQTLVLIGYGTDPKFGDFWLARNSWGTGYGESGNIRIARNKGNLCGVANVISAPCPLSQ